MNDTHPTDPNYEEWQQTLWEDLELIGQRCTACGHATAAPKAACARCGERSLERVRFPTSGTVYSWTSIEIAPADFSGPYDIALIELGDARVLGRVRGDPEIGDEVELADVFERDPGPAPIFETVDG